MAESQYSRPCKRCKATDAPYRLRNDPTCRSPRNCYVEYVEGKAGRRLGALARDTRTSAKPAPRKYIAGLSFGPSSTVMTHVLDDSAKFHSSRRSSPAFEPLVMHVDTDLSHSADEEDTLAHRLLAKYRERFPNVSFECVHLSKVLGVRTVDWSSLPGLEEEEDGNDTERLRRFFDSLSSVTSKADILRLFIRHLLLDTALDKPYTALLLGHSTTALASLTLSEVASGRGYAVPWQINDGPYTVCTYGPSSGASESKETSRAEMPIYYPLREVFRNEIMLYLNLIPSLRELIPADSAAAGNVVSHKNLSIEEVMGRYFDGVEGPYSGIVANVVRTTGKLERVAGDSFCHICGMPLDEQGDSRWAGELGDDLEEHGHRVRLCYGCKRSISG
ncbi:Cytoplasmic tRNA 2-thiolation protein 2 [Tolypocladium ophioglossoides CBS 100239]|uniref:Cytoplasmic tRNA 2-thiolation protein 2 n=1 Tax=Tolypocladium ophioglossoides (strain CBS 100239) TaxID=1163406 RepID=A0A0L0NGK1_TOLOC|nr:Cytoplasmic tRNA 2-thiolation protein 2 [Tolypocladium ophioglossoides CBS 100239]